MDSVSIPKISSASRSDLPTAKNRARFAICMVPILYIIMECSVVYVVELVDAFVVVVERGIIANRVLFEIDPTKQLFGVKKFFESK